MIHVSPHFTLEEVMHSQTAARLGIDNRPPDEIWGNIKAASVGMEVVRRELNSNPIIISSWYRSPKVNAAVGSTPASAHLSGYAIDFACPTQGSPTQIVTALLRTKVPFDQLIVEFNSWVHISFDPRMRGQALVIDHKGTRVFT